MEVTAVLKHRQFVLELANDLESTKNLVADLKDQLGTQSAIIAVQQTDINGLKEQVEQLSGRLDEQNVYIHELKMENKALLQTIQDAETSNELSNNSYMNEDNSETGKQNFHKSAEDVAEEIGEGHISTLERNLNYRNNGKEKHNRRFVLNREGPVAFHAVNNRDEIPHEAIMLDNVLLNIGGAYHSSTSLFIAEQFGVYIFSASIMSFVDPHQEFSAAIVKNGVILARIYGHGDNHRHDQGSATVVVQLNAGDEVWVRMEYIPDTSLFGDKYTTFSGALLWNV